MAIITQQTSNLRKLDVFIAYCLLILNYVNRDNHITQSFLVTQILGFDTQVTNGNSLGVAVKFLQEFYNIVISAGKADCKSF